MPTASTIATRSNRTPEPRWGRGPGVRFRPGNGPSDLRFDPNEPALPHLLNGPIDLARARIALGVSDKVRLTGPAEQVC